MATKTSSPAAKSHTPSKAATSHAKVETAVHKAEITHDKTVEHTTPINVTETLGMTDEESKIFDQERGILTNKLVQEVRTVNFDHLTWGDNVRTTRTLQLEKMMHSLKERGYNPKYPIVVSRKPIPGKGGKFSYLVLCGNRRTESLKAIKAAEPAIYKIILPTNEVPALVFDNLTPEEEIILRNDHSDAEDRVALDEEGLFYSVRQLVRAGYTSQNDLAAKLNLYKENPQTKKLEPNRSFIQQRVNLARLPKFIQDEFIVLMKDGKNSTKARWAQVAELFKLYMQERVKGHVDGKGPLLTAKWNSILTAVAPEGPDAEGSKMMTKTEIGALSETLGSRLGQLFLLKITGAPVMDGDKALDIGDIDGQMVLAEQSLTLLTDITAHMGEKPFRSMITEITKKRQAAAKKADEASPAAPKE